MHLCKTVQIKNYCTDREIFIQYEELVINNCLFSTGHKTFEKAAMWSVLLTHWSASVLPCNRLTTLYVTSMPQGIAASKANARLMSVIHCIWVQRNMRAEEHTYLTDPSFRSLLPLAPELTMKACVSLSGKSPLSSLTVPVHPRQK